MKKTIIALLALTGVASAASVGYSSMDETQKDGIVLAWDFSDGVATPDVGSVSGSFTLNTESTAAVLNSSSDHPWTGSLADSFAAGNFTLSFDIYKFEASNWQTLVSLYSANAGNGDSLSLQIGVTNSGELSVFNEVAGGTGYAGIDTDGNIGTGLTSSYSGSDTITLVSDMTDTQTLTLYVNGKQIGQYANWTASEGQALKGLQFGATFGGGRVFPDAEIGNVALWNKALSATDVAGLLVPEPTTATLSLLAMAGLAVRRRRR